MDNIVTWIFVAPLALGVIAVIFAALYAVVMTLLGKD